MTRTYEEKIQILTLRDQGKNKCEIERITGIPRSTIRDCISQYMDLAALEEDVKAQAIKAFPALKSVKDSRQAGIQQAYSYLLGIYLGDGCISKMGRTYSLRVSCDSRYPNIIEAIREAIQKILPHNVVDAMKLKYNCVVVGCYSNEWPELFPQHGEGMKYLRKIQLEQWQQEIVDQYPLEFFKGLYHSDGIRSQNIVKGKDYRRYSFTNMSEDIRQMFVHACELLGLHWTTKTSKRDIMISRREDVAYLDSLIGPKS
ncbi:MAG: hypothetical protein DPW16_17285 [Chloroflexi bacterium]|nr:hypothetical protein [Chloroflexota bacterium]